MTYLGQTKIAINNVKTLKLFTVTKLKIRHFSHFYNKCTANSDGRGLFGQKGDQKGTKSCINWQKSPLRGKSPLKGTQFSTLIFPCYSSQAGQQCFVIFHGQKLFYEILKQTFSQKIFIVTVHTGNSNSNTLQIYCKSTWEICSKPIAQHTDLQHK